MVPAVAPRPGRRGAALTTALGGLRVRHSMQASLLTAVAIAMLAGVAETAADGHTEARPRPAPTLLLPPVALTAADLVIVVNDADPASREIGAYYAERRGIAADHVVRVRFAPGQPVLAPAEFERLRAELEARQPVGVQAYALAWTLPYRVGCMSITSAFAFGFDAAWCADGCAPTRSSPYFDSDSTRPFDTHRLRPAMLLAGADAAEVRGLIDRGLRAENRWPAGTGYLVSTQDSARNVRAAGYARTRTVLEGAYPIVRVDTDALVDRGDVMFEFTGAARIAGMATNRFLDGAIADHLTSYGGVLDGSPHTSALEWLAAGATGSYGTVVEPCNYRAKFPEPELVMKRYLGGETLIEAYWKSVRMPGQGVFVGDPLARPFGGERVERAGDGWRVRVRALRPGRYLVQQARSGVGPYRSVGRLEVVGTGVRELRLPADADRVVRLLPQPSP